MNLLIFVIILSNIFFFIISEELLPEDYNKTWMYFSNGSDLPDIIYLTTPPISKASNTEDDPLRNSIIFELYTNSSTIFESIRIPFKMSKARSSNSHLMEHSGNGIHIIDRSNFNNQIETKIIVHGWKSSTQSDTIQNIKNEYFKRGPYNLIAVNWADLASDIYYMRPAGRTVDVGRAIAKVINYIVEKLQQNPQKIHLIGHSLGAHIVGFAGSFSKYRVKRITGLDPAKPAFEDVTGPEGHLDHTDAEFVDIIHSCAGVLGYSAPIGHVDFYPNGGTAPQPGCGNLFYMFSACSHGRSHRYFAESINTKKGFWSSRCSSWQSLQNHNCSKKKDILMGDPINTQARGIYYLNTNNDYEFAVGK